MAVQYCNYDIKGTLGVVGTATIGGALNVTEYIFRSGQGSNYHRFLASRQIFVVGNATSIDLNNGVSTFGATGGATTLQGTSMTLDASADITIDAGGGDIILSDDATIFGTISSSGGMQIRSRINDADMFFRGVDNGTEFNALTLDMSDAGYATFNSGISATNTSFNGTMNISGEIFHIGDTNTFFGFNANDTWRVVTGGTQRLDINNSGVRFLGSGVRVTTILDEDNMASNSATALATQQSIKTYVDTSVSGAGVGTFLPLAGGTMTGNIVLNDNIQLQVGSSGDLRIYHDGSNSYINEVGTGDLIIKGGNDILFQDAVGNTLANMNQANSVEL